jgi:hypothetical protein
MNIFELILSDPFSYQQVSNEFGNQQAIWKLFKENIDILFTTKVLDTHSFISKSK